MKFLKDFKNDIIKKEGITGMSADARYWLPSSSVLLNRLMTGKYDRFLPQGKITAICGPSGSGKSFLTGDLIANAQNEGAFILLLDSENALDTDYLEKIGVDTQDENKFHYLSVNTMENVTETVSSFIKGYESEHGASEDAPKVLICIDSLDMLMTDTETEHFQKGNTKGDMGQRSKRLKSMLRTFVQAIKHLNISIVATSQVYANQDLIMNPVGKWIVNTAIQYSLSHILMLTNTKLKDASKDVSGIKLSAMAFKTRFCKPYQKILLQIPYDEGIDPFDGVLEAAVVAGIVKQGGAWFTFGETKFQRKNATDELMEQILLELMKLDKDLDLSEEDYLNSEPELLEG